MDWQREGSLPKRDSLALAFVGSNQDWGQTSPNLIRTPMVTSRTRSTLCMRGGPSLLAQTRGSTSPGASSEPELFQRWC